MFFSCQEGWHRPALSLFAKVFIVFSCTLPKVTYSQKFAFAQRSGAMKAPVGLLSDGTVLHQQDGGTKSRQVRVCAVERSNESPSGAFKRQNGLAQQDGGATPRQVRVCAVERSNESPGGDFKRRNGLAQQDGGASPRQVHVDMARFLWQSINNHDSWQGA